MTLLSEFFRSKGRELKVADYTSMLERIFAYVHRNVTEAWGGKVAGLDLTLVVAGTTLAFAARCGGGELFRFSGGEARGAFEEPGAEAPLLGCEGWEGIEVRETPIEPGDVLVLCGPAVAKVIGARDMTLILRRAADPPKAGLFLSAIAERKGAEGPLAALLWEVPNYQGAALLTGEAPAAAPSEAAVDEAEEGELAGRAEPIDQADQAKRQWLSKWRKRKE